MQRGIIFLLCAAVLPFCFATSSTASIQNEEDYDIVDISDSLLGDYVPEVGAIETSPIMFSSISPYTTGGSFFQGQSYSSSAIGSGANAVVNPHTSIVGRNGLKNHSSICYMSSFLTATFNIRRFREAVYNCEPENVSTVMLAQVFAKLQTSKETGVKTNMCLMPAISAEFPWRFGGYECNMEFGGRFLDMLPNSVKDLYNLTVRTNYHLKENQSILKTAQVVETHFIIPPKYPSIAVAIGSRFRDHEAEDFIIERKDYHEYAAVIPAFEEDKKRFPIYNEVTIANRPQMMVFGIRRRNMTSFDSTQMKLDFELILPGLEEDSQPIKYVLKGFCVHLPNPAHYISHVRDFSRDSGEGDWYTFDDSRVSAITTVADYERLRIHADTSATLAFYVRADSISKSAHEPVIPSRIMTLTKLIVALEDIRSRKSEINREIEAIKENTYHPTAAYSSPPVHRLIAPSTPESVDAKFASIMKPGVHHSPMIGDDMRFQAKPRNENIPSPTHKMFLSLFPLDYGYFDVPVKEA